MEGPEHDVGRRLQALIGYLRPRRKVAREYIAEGTARKYLVLSSRGKGYLNCN